MPHTYTCTHTRARARMGTINPIYSADMSQTSRSINVLILRVRLGIILNARIKNVCKYESCMLYKLRMIFQRTVALDTGRK